MTDRLHPDNPDAPAVDLAELDPKLQLALRQVANVDECCRTLLTILDAMPVIEGLTTTIPDEQEKRPRLWIHDAIRSCERLPKNWQRDVRRAWQLLGDSVNLYNQTVTSMGRYVEHVNTSLNGQLTTSAHKWARRFLDRYAGDLEHVQTLLDGSETAFDELETNSLRVQSDPLADEMSISEMMGMMDALAAVVLGKLAEAGHIAPTEPALVSDGKLLPLKLDTRPMTAILGLLPAAADDDAEVVAVDAADDDTADDSRYIDGIPVVHPTPPMTSDELAELTRDMDLATVKRRRLLFSPDEVWAKLRAHGFDSATSLAGSRPLDSLLDLADGLGVTAIQLEQLWWMEARVRGELAEWAHSLLIRLMREELPTEGWMPDSEESRWAMAAAFSSWACSVEGVISKDDCTALSEGFKGHLFSGWVPVMPEDELSALLREQIDELVNATTGAVEDHRPDTDQSVPARLADETVAARCRRTVRRYQWAVGALCAAAVVILMVTGMMTYRAQERAKDAAKQADVRIADAESKAKRAIEQAQTVMNAPMAIEVKFPDSRFETWPVEVNGEVTIGEHTVTLRREEQ